MPQVRLGDTVRAFRARHATAEGAAFFTIGFLVDVFTLGRIDNWANLVQQAVYLVLLATLLLLERRVQLKAWTPKGAVAQVWRFSEDAIHFLFGSLLSAYALFYLKSASGLASAVFLAFLFGMLVANELPRFRRLGPVVRVALFSLCLTSYFAYLFPVLFGFLSGWLFVLAVGSSTLVLSGLFRSEWKWSASFWGMARRVAAPALGMQVLLLGLYFAKLIPPVPLAVQFMGIYHEVVRDEGDYLLSHQNPWWRAWHNGDQLFAARSGDPVYCFVRIFAPTAFKERVNLRWSYKDPKRGWQTWDVIPLGISGGRNEGYRGYAYKSKYLPGEWRVTVETADGRGIGSIRFWVTEDTTVSPRVFHIDRA